MEDIQIRLGKALRQRRRRLGVSQEEFADLCGLDRTYVGGIERGERNLGFSQYQETGWGAQNVSFRTISWSLSS